MAEAPGSQFEGNICPVCGRRFVCGMAAGAQVCWCAQLPALPGPPDPALGCLCPDCLRERLPAVGQDPA